MIGYNRTPRSTYGHVRRSRGQPFNQWKSATQRRWYLKDVCVQKRKPIRTTIWDLGDTLDFVLVLSLVASSLHLLSPASTPLTFLKMRLVSYFIIIVRIRYLCAFNAAEGLTDYHACIRLEVPLSGGIRVHKYNKPTGCW